MESKQIGKHTYRFATRATAGCDGAHSVQWTGPGNGPGPAAVFLCEADGDGPASKALARAAAVAARDQYEELGGLDALLRLEQSIAAGNTAVDNARTAERRHRVSIAGVAVDDDSLIAAGTGNVGVWTAGAGPADKLLGSPRSEDVVGGLRGNGHIDLDRVRRNGLEEHEMLLLMTSGADKAGTEGLDWAKALSDGRPVRPRAFDELVVVGSGARAGTHARPTRSDHRRSRSRRWPER